MNLKLAFLALLSVPYLAVANQCYGFYSETHPQSFSLAQIGKWRSTIVKDIVECTAGTCLIWPQAFVQNFSLLESSFATSTATRLARTAQESMTEIERELSSQIYRADLNTVIRTERQTLLDLQGGAC